MAEVQLFGGAITCLFPAEFEDISSIRQVPDHQEVYVHRGFDSSFIVEVLEYVQDKPYAGDALLHHWQDIVETNSASDVCVDLAPEVVPLDQVSESVRGLVSQGNGAVVSMVGAQSVSKFKEAQAAANRVQVYVGLIRLPQFGTDLLVSLNLPLIVNPQSSSNRPQSFQQSLDGPTVFKQALTSLKIVNPRLFG